MIQPSSFLNNYSEEAFKDFRTRVLLDSGFFESEEGTKPTFVYNNSILTTPLDSDAQEFIKATGIKDNTIVSYINTYVVKLKRFGLWSKIKALYPFISDNRNLASYTESINAVSLGTNASLSTTEPSPTGSLNAVRVNNAGANPYNFQSFTLPQNTQYTFSVYVRAVTGTVNFGMYINHSNGGGNLPITTFTATTTWQRFNITFNTSTFPNNWFTVINFMTGNIEFWGWQLELGSTATAYQPVLGLSSTVYTNQFKYNLKDPRDLDAAFRLTFSGGWQFSQLGATPNGTNAFADTKVNMLNNLSQNNTHISFYSRTDTSGLRNFFGAGNTNDNAIQMAFTEGGFYLNLFSSGGNNPIFNSTNTIGMFNLNRTDSTNVSLIKNTVKASRTLASTTGSNLDIYLSAQNINGIASRFDIRQCAFASIGDGLTDADATNLYYITEELQANLKRNVSPYTQFRGILDEYPGAAAAYSLRRLSGSYGGPLIKVRRSSDNTEQDIFPLGNGSLDTTSLLSFVGANNGFVTTWYDQSGNGNNTLQGTAASQPQIVNAGIVIIKNNKPSVQFDGTNDYLASPNVTNVFMNSSMFSVLSIIPNATEDVPFGYGLTGQATQVRCQYVTPSNKLGFAGWSNDYVTNIDAFSENVYMFSTIQNVSNVSVRKNLITNSGTTSGTSTNTTTAAYNIGSLSGALVNTYYTQMTGSEFIFYQSDQTPSRTAIESNINTYYNLYWDGSRKGLLDFYPNAAAAYSVRALSSSYRGPLVKVRRSSDNVERDFYALQNGNLDTFGLATFCAGTDGFVTTWYDQSGVGRNATQSTAGKQPQIVSAGTVITENGKPCVSIGTGSTLNFSSVSVKTAVFLIKVNVFQYNRIFGDSIELQSGTQGYINALTGNPSQFFPVSIAINGIQDTTSPYGSNLVGLYHLGYALSNTTSTQNQIGWDGATSRSLAGIMQELIFYPNNESNNRIAIETNINLSYTIY
jgi:hypothetical protein